MAYLLSNKAAEDLAEIYEYSFLNFGKKQADLYANKIIASIDKIVENPYIGKDASMLASDLRYFTLDRHHIYYRDSLDKKLLIVRILHVSMNHNKQFGNTVKINGNTV